MVRKSLVALGALALSVGAWSVLAVEPEGAAPDVIVGVLPDLSNHGSVGSIQAYSVGTTSCNIGDAELNWIAGDNRHPVIGGNLYQIKDGRLRQVGYSWLKHGFTALQQNACGLGCQSSGTGSRLGVGCSDPYTSSLNGGRPMGLRREVNATRGYYPNTWQEPNCPGGCSTIDQRLQAHRDDLTSGNGELYFYEAQYVTADDAMAGNGLNNASYRPVTVNGSFGMSLTAATVQAMPAIYAWQAADSGVYIDEVMFQTTGGPAPAGDDRFPGLPDPPELLHVGTRIHDEGGGQYRWEIAVHNLNSHRSVQSVTVPIPPNATVSTIGFHDVDAHSGEEAVISTTDWSQPATPVVAGAGGTTVTWATETFAQNPNANAIRWGTTYSFWIIADAQPAPGSQITLGLFRTPGSPTAVNASMFGTLFDDGFESGNTSAWSSTVP